ncbi:MAG: c-type cytochrome [Candidatus Poribacteria bacterium]|nr:c-type cytochrome [Candidatus Poribacteria bacterium]
MRVAAMMLIASVVIAVGCSSRQAPAGETGAEMMQTEAMSPDFSQTGTAFLKQYCVKCHGGATPAGDLHLDLITDAAAVAAEAHEMEEVLEMLEKHAMPPQGQPQPTQAEIDSFVGQVNAILASAAK